MSSAIADDGFFASALPVFITEAGEQLDALEQLLMQLEAAPEDRELLDALFRCAHTIKGSAGIFGLGRVVRFTHHVESLLDRLREGEVRFAPALSTLLLQCADHMRTLVSLAAASPGEADADTDERDDLVAQLRAAGAGGADAPAATAGAASAEANPDAGLRRWHVTADFGTNAFRNGIDPLALLTYVRGLGVVPHLVMDAQAVPELDALDAESCHLAFQFSLDTRAARDEIEAAFSFARDDCRLHIIEPPAGPQEFAALIAAMPDNPRLGEILIAVGAITRAQLQQALQLQANTAASSGVAPPLGELLQATSGLSSQVVNAALDKQQRQQVAPKPREAAAADETRVIRVQAERLDAVITLLGELVIAGAGATLLARQTRQRALVSANQQITRLVEDIRNATLQLRMVPIGETFARFRRVVRDTAAQLGKDVALEITGGDTELDKSMVERIADPLMHLVRNGLDHGLETPEERLAAGKPAQGRLTLAACHESGGILIRISDDGRGIQRDKVLQRAWERGLVERGVVPEEAEILNLIFQPGFSTAEQVTDLSGRGVGMDVVRRNIEALRGSVMLSSQPGQGSSIEIRLPLTLAIIDGFLVGVGHSRFIFPLEAVVEVIEDRHTHTQMDARGRTCVELRGSLLPVVSLRALYALDSPAPERCSVVVVRSGAAQFGVKVDTLLGQHQTVIKPLARLFRSLRGISGSSILGTGEVALIFDVPALHQLAAQAQALRASHPSTHGDLHRAAINSPEGQPS